MLAKRSIVKLLFLRYRLFFTHKEIIWGHQFQMLSSPFIWTLSDTHILWRIVELIIIEMKSVFHHSLFVFFLFFVYFFFPLFLLIFWNHRFYLKSTDLKALLDELLSTESFRVHEILEELCVLILFGLSFLLILRVHCASQIIPNQMELFQTSFKNSISFLFSLSSSKPIQTKPFRRFASTASY